MRRIVMFKKVMVFGILMLACTAIFAQSILDDKIQMNDENFIKAIADADVVVTAVYIQGGKTKAKVSVKKAIVGDVSGDIEIVGIDNEKLRRRYKRDDYKKGDTYLFMLKKNGAQYKLIEDSVSIPMTRDDKANFSLITPYQINFWQPFDGKLLEIAIKAIREKSEKMMNDATKSEFDALVAGYIEKNDQTSLRAALAVAKYADLVFDYETYDKFISGTNTLACIAVKFSGKIMGEIYFNQNILPKAEGFNPDNQTAFGYAAMSLYSKQSVPTIGKILNKASIYNPSTSECFPVQKPASNKEVFVRTLIEIDAPETMRLLVAQIESGDAEWLSKVLAIVAEYEGADLTEMVLKAATDERSSERMFEFNAYFDKTRSKATAKTLISLFKKRSDILWNKAILAYVGKYKFPETLPFLISVLNENPNEEIRTAAAMAIGQVGHVDGAKPLYDFITRERSILAKSIGIESLAKINDKSVQKYLKDINRNETDPKVREDAVNALEDNLFLLRYGREKD